MLRPSRHCISIHPLHGQEPLEQSGAQAETVAPAGTCSAVLGRDTLDDLSLVLALTRAEVLVVWCVAVGFPASALCVVHWEGTCPASRGATGCSQAS